MFVLTSWLAGAALACHAASGVAPPTDAGQKDPTDAGLEMSTAESSAGDAAPDISQDPNVYPAKHGPIPQIDYLGGPVLGHMKVVTVTFQGDVWRADIESFGDTILKSEWWRSVVAEYGVGDGESKGHVVLPDTVSNTAIHDEDIATFLQAHVQTGELPPPDDSTVYVLYYPAMADIFYARGALQSCVDFVGLHSEGEIAQDAGRRSIAYAVVARCPGFGAGMKEYVTIAASHVLAEAATNPYPLSAPAYKLTTNDAWRTAGQSATSDEIGDLCGIRRSVDAGGVAVQRIWSNRASAESRPPCLPQPPDEIAFGAAIRTELQTVSAHKSYGYLVMDRGESRDAILDVFSGAALPRDLALYVGRDRGAADPVNLDDLPPGLAATLSKTTAHNGDGLIMRVVVSASAQPGDHPFVVRAVLDPQHYSDWPVIVHVR